jgi:5-methylcytosine-specific restriction endonuclease McrA
VYRVKCNVSKSICKTLKLRGKTKGGSTFDHLPYTPEGLAEHLENLFDEHMTWDNHGTYWHIDHIRPHASFKYDSLDHPEFQECWALENLRPLKASENMSKGSLWEGKRHYYNEAV